MCLWSYLDSVLIFFQIYRPVCPDDTNFCYRTYSCLPLFGVCADQNSRWHVKCTGNTIYSLRHGVCVDKTTRKIVPQIIASSWASMPMNKFFLANETRIKLNYTGLQTLTLGISDSILVEEGDIIGIYEVEGRIGYVASANNYQFRSNPGSNIDTDEAAFPDGQSVFSSEHQHLVRFTV